MLARVARNGLRALRLDRSLYQELQFSSETAGDAVVAMALLLVVGWLRLLFDGRFSLSPLLSSILSSVVLWVVAGALLWLVATKLFDGLGGIQNTISLAGFAFLPWVLMSSFGFSLLSWSLRVSVGAVLVPIALLWTGLGMVLVAEVAVGVERPKSVYSAAIAAVGLWAVRLLLF
jgi:hypothetical protein